MRCEHARITYQYPIWVNNTLGSQVAKPAWKNKTKQQQQIPCNCLNWILKMPKLAFGITIKQIAYSKQYQIYNLTLVLSFTSWLSMWYYWYTNSIISTYYAYIIKISFSPFQKSNRFFCWNTQMFWKDLMEKAFTFPVPQVYRLHSTMLVLSHIYSSKIESFNKR